MEQLKKISFIQNIFLQMFQTVDDALASFWAIFVGKIV